MNNDSLENIDHFSHGETTYWQRKTFCFLQWAKVDFDQLGEVHLKINISNLAQIFYWITVTPTGFRSAHSRNLRTLER